MQGRHAVDSMAPDGSEVRHPHSFIPALVDQRHPGDARFVARIALAHFSEEAAVYLVNDLEQTRQHTAEQRQPPGFEGLRQERVISKSARAPRDIPGLLP